MIATSSAVAERTVPSTAAGAGARLHLPERAEEDVPDRAVHRPAHHHREQRSRRADERAAHDQDVRVELEPGRRRREAGEGVQQRDHDRHVGAADRQHEQHAEDERADEQRHEQPLLLGAGDDRDAGGDERRRAAPRFTTCWPGIRDRPALDQLLQLRERDHRAGERDRADQRREHDRDRDVAVQVPRLRREVVELRERDERRRAAADAVEQRHHLRHRGHLHAARADRPERPRRSPRRR